MLKITPILPRIRNHALTAFKNIKNQALKCVLNRDIFIGTLRSPYINKERVREIYDEVYDEIVTQNIENNPILNEVIINKPEIKFGEANNGISEAIYSPDDNTITINLKYLNMKKCAVVAYSNEGLPDLCWFGEKTLLDRVKDLIKKKHADFKVIDLSQDELEIYLKGMFAHELRHCIQTHLIISSHSAQEIIDRVKQKQGSEKKNSDDSQDEFQNSYIFRYKPKRILPKDAKLKMSLDKEDDRYLSIDEDFVLADYTPENIFDREEYLANIKEQDAFRYQYEYCISKINDWKNLTNAREEVITCYIADIRNNFAKSNK